MSNEERSSILGAGQPPPKLLIERLTEGEATCLRLSGIVDEQFDAPGLAQTINSRYVILDLGGVDRISSFGIRQWVDFIATIGPRLAGVYYVECSPKVVDQFNMVANFGGPGYIVSFYAPYRCENCDQERRLLFRTDEETPLWRAGQAPPSTCPTCGNPEDFDEDPATYFNYVAQQPMAQLPAPVMNFLRVHLSYGQGGQRKLKIEKKIEGRCTYLKLSGDLDSDLKAQKLADGLEGEVVVDLGGILSIDPVGTAQWRKLMQLLDAKTGGDEQVDRLNLLSVPAPFLERLGKPEDLTRKGQVLSLLIPYNCARCRATTQRLVDFSQHGDELRQGRVPRIKCAICSGPVTCVVSETWFSRLQTLPPTVVSDELRRTLARLTAAPPPGQQQGVRSTMGPGTSLPALTPQPQPSPAWTQQPSAIPAAPFSSGPPLGGPRMTLNPLATSSAGAVMHPGQRNSLLTAAGPVTPAPPPPTTMLGKLQSIPGILPGLLIVMLSLSGAVVYKILSAPSSRGALEWKVVESSLPKAPAWHDPRFVSKSDHVFIGHSPLVPDKTEAMERADVAAQTELATRLGDALAAKYPEWRKTVQPLYASVQQALLDELDKAQKAAKAQTDPTAAETQLAPVRERVAESHKRVAVALRGGVAEVLTAAPVQYWEKRARTVKGNREVAYQASSTLELDNTTFDKLVNFYGQSEVAAKVRAVPYFPLLAVRYDASVAGAIVMEIDPTSPAASAKLQPSDIIVAISGREVRNAKDFAKLLTQGVDESASREVIIKVQRGDELIDLKLQSSKKAGGPGGKKTGKKGR